MEKETKYIRVANDPDAIDQAPWICLGREAWDHVFSKLGELSGADQKTMYFEAMDSSKNKVKGQIYTNE